MVTLTKQTFLIGVLIAGLATACIGLLASLLAANKQIHSLKNQPDSLRWASARTTHNFEWWTQNDLRLLSFRLPPTPEGVAQGRAEPGYVNDGPVQPVSLQPWEKNVRLPRSVVPIHYDLYLHPNLQTDSFTGSFFSSISFCIHF